MGETRYVCACNHYTREAFSREGKFASVFVFATKLTKSIPAVVFTQHIGRAQRCTKRYV